VNGTTNKCLRLSNQYFLHDSWFEVSEEIFIQFFLAASKPQDSTDWKRPATEENIPAKIPKTAEEDEESQQESEEDFDVNRDVKCGISPSVYLREQSIMFNMASCLPPHTGIDVGYSFEDLPWESFVKSVLELNKINHKVDQKQLTESLDLMEHQLTHGDIVNMADYRLIHAYVVYRLKSTDTPLLLKTYMEYGYGAPCDFSDARGYFLGAYDLWYYHHLPDCLWPGSDIYDEAMKEIQERKNPDRPSASRRGHQSIEPLSI